MADSTVDESVPEDNVKVDKALLRENFRRTKEEITLLNRNTGLARQIAYGIVSL